MTKRIAIIGGGPAGLVSAKSCLEVGLQPVLFEKSSSLGGVWSGGDNGLAWDEMQTNISKWSCMFSDFPWEQDVQDFPTRTDMTKYLENYANAFHLNPHICFESEVTHVSQAGDTWRVTSNGQSEEFDAVIIASGVFANKMMPDLPYKDFFDGDILHASQIRSTKQIAPDKRITVYGGSLSAYELASEFSRISIHPVIHGFANPAWVMTKYLTNTEGHKIPLDLKLYMRKDPHAPARTSTEMGKASIDFLKAACGNPGDVHPALRVKEAPDKPRFSVVSDGYLNAIRERKIVPIRGSINGFDQRYLIMKGIRGSVERVRSDTIIMATGYKGTLPYLNDNIQQKIGYDEKDQFMPVTLSHTVWPKDVNGLAFVGFYRGPYFAIMELQARWAAGVLSGNLPTPTKGELIAGVNAARILKEAHPRPQFPYADYVGLADILAKKVGCYPDLDQNDPMFHNVTKGFFLPSHFRLKGPHSNRELAEDVIGSIPYIK